MKGESGDDTGVGRLLRTIADQPVTPSSVDIDRALHRGRALRRFRAMTASGLAVVAIAGVGVGVAYVRDGLRASAVTAAAGCTVSKLDLPPGITSAHRIVGDPTGRYFAAQGHPEPGGGKPVGILWDNGVPQVIAVQGRYVLPKAVNEHGTVVGVHDTEGKDGRFFRYANGSLVDLPTGVDGGTAADASISGSGVVAATVGTLSWQSDVPQTINSVVKFAAGSTQPVVLPGQDDGRTYRALFVGNDGTVVGSQAAGSRVDPQVVQWSPNGVKSTVTHPAAFPENGVFGETTSARWLLVSNMAGMGWDVDPIAILWNVESGAAQAINSMRPVAVNAGGHVAGATSDETRPVVLRNGVVTSLPTLHPDEFGRVEAIGDNGTMAGWVSANPTRDDTQTPVIWRGC